MPRSVLASVVVAVLASVPAGGAVIAQGDGTVTDVDLMAPASVSGVMTLGSPNQPHTETPGEPPDVAAITMAAASGRARIIASSIPAIFPWWVVRPWLLPVCAPWSG